jgi:hypothetical protein
MQDFGKVIFKIDQVLEEKNRILVKFNDGEKMFIFPETFEKGFLKPQK